MKKIIGLILVMSGLSFGATRTWDHECAVDSFSCAVNWSGDAVPGTADTAAFDSATSNSNCLIGANATVRDFKPTNYSGTVTINQGLTVTFSAAKTFFKNTGKFSMTGSGDITINVSNANLSDTIDNLNSIDYSGDIIARFASSSTGTPKLYVKRLILPNTTTITFSATSVVDTSVNFYFIGDTVATKSFQPGVGISGAKDSIFHGSTIFDIGAYNASLNQVGLSRHLWQSAKFLCFGNVTLPSSDTSLIIPGTSSWILDSSTASTITSNNKSFYNFKVAKTSSGTVTLADSLTVLGNFVDTLGKFKTAGFNMNLSGDFYRYSADSMLASTSVITLNKANTLWKRLAPSAPFGGMASATVRAINGVDFDLDTNMTVYRLVSASGKKLKFTAGRIFKDSTYTSGDLNNDTLMSRTGGAKAYLNLPANTPLTDSWIKDIYAINTIYDTVSTGLNGGNDSNIVFKYASGIYAMSPTVVTVTSASPSSVPVAGGTLDTLTGTGFYPPCSVLVAGGSYISATFIDTTKISFTTPASTAGLKSVTVKNGDFKNGGGNVLTYTAPITDTIPIIDSIRPAGGIFGAQVTVYGSTFGAAPSGYLNGALAPYVSRDSVHYTFNVTDIPARGNVPVVIKNNVYNTYDTIQLFIFYEPVLASVTPNHGVTGGGDTIEIRCDSGGAVDTVWFQNDFVIPFYISDSLIKCVSPAHAATTVNVSVHDTNGYVDTLQSAYEYNNLYGWTVTHPASLDTAGGDTIKFHSEYGQVTANTVFTFDGSIEALTTNTDTLSTYITPAHAKGSVPWSFDALGTVRTGTVRYGAVGQRRRGFGFLWGGFRF
jgi:hypothetical protein